ncbi:HAD family hydrolase [Enterococcus faecium]|uniref:HAD family hydrolase n=1 Tax=Enterococcus faecium TaxID=1352 RepID=UPI00226D8F26|nr:HAD-IIB family hydrolase [Enterococcus faecium]
MVKIVYMNTDVPYLNSIEEDLKNDTQNSDISYSSNRYLEINHSGVTKGEGLNFLTNYLGIDMHDTIAIGDNFNDQSMLEVAGFSVGVQNMVLELKEDMDYITESTHDEHAVAHVINKFILKRNLPITQNK